MTMKTLLPTLIAVAAASAPPLLAQAPVAAVSADPCSAAPQAIVRKKALMGFARSLAGNLPMIGRGSAVATLAGQTAGVALEAQAASEAQHPAGAVTCGQG
jgi:NADH dehydrogenase FAD-containing subunit